MLFCGAGRLLHAAFNGETPALQMGGKLGLQLSQTLPGIDFVGVETSVRRHRYMQEVHVRRLFIHVNHCGNDILRAHKIREKGFALFKEASGVLRGKFLEKCAVRCDDKPAHAHGVLSHGLDQQKVVNAILNGLCVVV